MSKNDITGDNIKSKLPSEAYNKGYDRIFCKHDCASDGDPGPDCTMTLTCVKCGTKTEATPSQSTKEK